LRRWRRVEEVNWEKILTRYANAFRRSREPLFVLARKHKLSRDEKAILLTLLAYGYVHGENMLRIPDVLNLLWRNGESIGKVKYLDRDSKLVRSGIVTFVEDAGGYFRYRRMRDIYPMVEVPCELMHKIIEVKFPERKVEETEERKAVPRVSLSSVFLPERTWKEVHEFIDFIKKREEFRKRFGLHEKLGTESITALFYGPPGTGKTMTAEAIAHELRLSFHPVNYARLISHYVGMTQKNMERLFEEGRGGIIFIDEVDAILTRRVETQRYVDVAYNQELLYLMQQLERFDGVVIMTTNRKEALDPALERRILFSIEFPMPDVEIREKIWEKFLEGIPLEKGLTPRELAEIFEVSGGEIRNLFLRGIVRMQMEGSSVFKLEYLEDLRKDRKKKKIGFKKED